MATVKRFEELKAWQEARVLVRSVYAAFKGCGDSGFTDQIQRASVSVLSNIAEGFESGTRQEFVNYLYIAKASCGEVRAQLYAAYDIGYIDAVTFKDLKCKAELCSKLIASFAKGVKNSPYDGVQRKREQTEADKEVAAIFEAGRTAQMEAIRRGKQ